ncbi:stage III sporulation protein AA [Clostridium fermenticellae]|uniref:Stage III sporulation protein AA n=1 Tax=Clostridium fermenticellae TaxID=2068654 RepID=A0A386H4C9_9CLOT|nr:stage III sporulation protein AA [Clostridium fermenticellae]
MRKIDTKEIINILPQGINNVLKSVLDNDKLQEIRMRMDKPLIIEIGNDEFIYDYVVKKEDMKIVIQRISNYSIYAFEEEIKKGYITIRGGHRIGICGRCIIEKNEVKTIKNIGSINIRICHEVSGCSNKIMKFIVSKGEILNSIIISPPKCGKTTLIRDITKNVSNGFNNLSLSGKKVCVIDERSEIAGCYNGVPQLDVGVRTDILDSCPKSDGIIMAIRSMSPDLVVCDEIGTYKEMDSIVTALNSGISLIVTIHGYGVEDLYKRPVFKEIIDNNVFKRCIVLSTQNGAGTIEYVYDFNSKTMMWRR